MDGFTWKLTQSLYSSVIWLVTLKNTKGKNETTAFLKYNVYAVCFVKLEILFHQQKWWRLQSPRTCIVRLYGLNVESKPSPPSPASPYVFPSHHHTGIPCHLTSPSSQFHKYAQEDIWDLIGTKVPEGKSMVWAKHEWPKPFNTHT